MLSDDYTDSIKSVASTIAYGTMSYYTGNITNTPDVCLGLMRSNQRV